MKIQEIQIKGLFGKKDIAWQLNPQVNVLVGVNGSGKSTILSILHDILSIQVNEKKIHLFDNAKVVFSNNTETSYIPTMEIIENKVGKSKDANIDLLKIIPLLFTGLNPILALGTAAVIALSTTRDNNKELREEIVSKSIFGENNKDRFYLDLIESNLMNSNANHIIQKSDQKISNVLDLEIKETIFELNKIKNNKNINKLLKVINIFFNQIYKEVSYKDNKFIYFDKKLEKELNYSDLSSGERQLIYTLLRVALIIGNKNKKAIILMDEPEISLHLDWQEYFIKQLTLLNPNAQFIIVTHSPALIMNGWNDVYTDMEEITTWL